LVDFAEVKRKVSIESAIPLLGLTMSQKGPQYRGPCPACRSGGDRALAINSEKSGFYCFASTKSGDVISLTAHIRDIPAKDAAEWLDGGTKTATPTETTFKKLDNLEADHPAVDAIGFDAKIAATLGIGFCSKGILKGTVAIPVRNENGTIFGYVGVTDATLPASFKGANVVELKRDAS
jgi:DNA primase